MSRNWSPGPIRPCLRPQEVHVWRAPLNRRPTDIQELRGVLSPDELARASRFIAPRHRDYFVAARGTLRRIIARYVDRPPATIEFAYEAGGKPSVRLFESDPPLSFNLSHSHDMAVFAFARARDVGVDVERLRSDFTTDDIARRFFSSAEREELAALPSEQHDEGFFLCWTRKEAYVKAIGGGLSIPLDSFDVSLSPGTPPRLVSADSHRWMLRSLEPAAGYVAAVVAEGLDWELRCWDWLDQPGAAVAGR